MNRSNLKRKQSALEIYLDLLKAFAKITPLNLTQIQDQFKLNSSSLSEKLDFLIKQGLLEQITLKENKDFIITERGISVLKFFRLYPATNTFIMRE